MHLSPYALIAVLTVVYLVLGTALDGISMIVLTSAVVLPMIQKAGFDLIWFGIFIVCWSRSPRSRRRSASTCSCCRT
jgi:TRAP-type C4-dicarboxylate transport system permease large subunit